MVKLWLASLAVTFFFFNTDSVTASNLLQNGDFESMTTYPWVTSGGGTIATLSAQLAHNGNYSLKIQHDKTSSYGFQQTVTDIEAGQYYQISGYAASDSTGVDSYFSKIAWYTSNDASGPQMSTTSETSEITKTDNRWTPIQEIFQAPNNSHSLKIRLVLKSKISGSAAYAYFDDIVFELVADPTPTEQPSTASPPTPTTKTPTSTSTSTTTPPSPTVTPIPTQIPQKTTSDKSASNVSSNIQIPESIKQSSILGTTSAQKTLLTASDSTQARNSVFPFPNILKFSGIAILILGLILGVTFIAQKRYPKV